MSRKDKISTWYAVTSGTVRGHEHVRLGKNNQDGLAITVDDDLIVAVVTDGCSSGRSSEVGANLAARWLSEWTPWYVRVTGGEPGEYAPAVARGLVGQLKRITKALTAWGGPDAAVVQEFFLFTFLVAVVSEARTTIFGIGDGVFSVDGERFVLDSGEDNAPDYLGYGLVGEPRQPVVHYDAATDFRALQIATDGAASLDLAEFARDERYVSNPSLLHKRLRTKAEQLFDDTTCVLIRRRRCA